MYHNKRWMKLLTLTAAATVAVSLFAAPNAAPGVAQEDPIVIGVSGPLTGPRAQYGLQWQKGFALALEEINGAGGIKGRKLEIQFEDSQADPKQSVIIAQKFVADPRIIVELGDFASTASMAASPIYQRGGLVQFGFTNSHPDFTKAGGDFTWSTSVTQTQASAALAEFTVEAVGVKNLAVFFQNSDWGKVSNELFVKRAEELGAKIVASESYLPDETDFRSAITNVKDAKPDGIILFSYQADGALIAQQARDAGLTAPFIAGASIQSPDYLTLGGKAVDGTYVLGEFTINDPRPEVQAFVKKYQTTYKEDPDLFATLAYDSVILVAAAIELGGPTREGVHKAFAELKDVPSIVYGKVTFDLETRRAKDPKYNYLVVKDGKFAEWDGKSK